MRLAIGNGLRAEIWREFLNRFGEIEIREFYASTEGNVGFMNYAGKIGAIGRVNFFHRVRTVHTFYFIFVVYFSFALHVIVRCQFDDEFNGLE